MEQKIRYYDYKQFEKDVDIIVEKIRYSKINYKNIFAIPKGGLILGVILSHRLGIPMIFNTQNIKKNETLIVDDIVDTGKTLERFKDYNTICLHYKPKTACFKPTIYVHETTEYVKYFWEYKCLNNIEV